MWTYADFEEQTTDALRLDRLRLHISEVRAAIGPDVAGDGISRASGSLTAYLKGLEERRRELEAIVRASQPGGRISYVRKSKP